MYKLKIISSTVRPGRKGPLVANWIAEQVLNENLEDIRRETLLTDLHQRATEESPLPGAGPPNP